MNQTTAIDPARIKELTAQLPEDPDCIDDDFLEAHGETLSGLKEMFAEKGGIHLITVDDYSMICRLPTREHFRTAVKKANGDEMLSDKLLLGYVLIYPTMQVIERRTDHGAAGLMTSAVRKLAQLSKMSVEATSKKL